MKSGDHSIGIALYLGKPYHSDKRNMPRSCIKIDRGIVKKIDLTIVLLARIKKYRYRNGSLFQDEIKERE